MQNGCGALVVERFLDDVNVPQVLVSNGRAAMARISEAFFNHPERKMRFVGITGTKGKTTTSYMVKSICEQAGFKCGLVGTTGNMIGEKHIPSSKTTPDPIDLMRDLNEMVQAGVQVVVMEVSAHALDMHRLLHQSQPRPSGLLRYDGELLPVQKGVLHLRHGEKCRH